VKHWPRLPREAVAVPSLAGPKARLDGSLSTLVWWNMSQLTAEGLRPDDLKGPFQPLPFYDSKIHPSFNSGGWGGTPREAPKRFDFKILEIIAHVLFDKSTC